MFEHFKLIDLTHTLSSSIPTWDGAKAFELNKKEECIWMKTSAGTHMDAPSMKADFGLSANGSSIEDLPLQQLFAPCIVLDVSKKAHAHYQISETDILEFEQTHGRIAPHSLVIAHTGWDKNWAKKEAYRHANASGIACGPTFSVEAIKILLSRHIVGIGMDCFGPDPFDSDFPVHKLLFEANKYILENLTNCHLLPPKGAFSLALPIKINGQEAPARVIAFIEA